MLLQLGRFPRVRLSHVPTPLAIGGYKTGKSEYLVADALSEGADTLITLGAIQSNHARQTAAAELAADEVRRAGGRAGLLAYEPASAA